MTIQRMPLKARIGTNSVIERVSDREDFNAFCPSLPGCIARGPTEKDAITGLAEKIADWFVQSDADAKLNHPMDSLRKWYFVLPDIGYEREFSAHYSLQQTREGSSAVICSLPVEVPGHGSGQKSASQLVGQLKAHFGGEANRTGWGPNEKIWLIVTSIEY